MIINKTPGNNSQLVNQVENLNEEVKSLAINLAIYLAKAKSTIEDFNQMEPAFIRLINGTVKVVQELSVIINAAKNMETMAYDIPSGKISRDHIEAELNSIMDQCQKILRVLTKSIDVKM